MLCGEGNDGGGGGEAGGDGGEGDSGARRSEFMEKSAESFYLANSLQSTQIINLTIKSSQVQSSQVKSSSNFNGGRARRLWGARRRERSGGRGAAQLAWLDSRIDSKDR